MEFLSSWDGFPTTCLKIVVDVFGHPRTATHVCKVWLWVSNVMLSVERFIPIIFMAVDVCGCQLAGRLDWMAPVFLTKQDVARQPADIVRRADWHIWGAGWDVECRWSEWMERRSL